jgi:hypothetical protein
MAGAVDKEYYDWNSEITDTSLNIGLGHEAMTNARMCNDNSTCIVQHVDQARHSDIYCSKMICYEKEMSRRRLQEFAGSPSTILSEDSKYLIYMPLAFQTYVDGMKNGLKSVLQNPKLSMLARGHKEVKSSHGRKLINTEEINEIKAAGKAGCAAAALIPVAFYGSILFGICGIVFASIQGCVCCKGACGGYRGQNKMFAIYGAVATIWQLIPFIMYLSFYLATERVVKVLLKFGIAQIADIFNTILSVLLICVLLASSLIVSRGINAFLSWTASQSPHSVESPTAVIVQASGQVQMVPQVQMVKQENYVVVDPQQQA